MRRIGLRLFSSLGLLLLAGCSKPAIPTLPSNPLLAQPIPPKSVLVLFVDWTRISSDEYFQKLVKKEELEKSFRDVSIDPNRVSAMVVFTDIGREPERINGGILIGLFDQKAVVDTAKAKGWAEESYLEYTTYFNQKENGWMAFLKSGSLVAGSKRAVQGAIDVESGRQPSFVTVEPFDRVVTKLANSQQVFSMVVAIPQAIQDVTGAALDIIGDKLDEHELGPLGDVLKKICLAKGFSVSMSRQGKTFPVEMAVITSDEKSARFLSGSLNLLKGLSKLIPKEEWAKLDDATKQAFESLSVERDGEILSLKMTMPEQALGLGDLARTRSAATASPTPADDTRAGLSDAPRYVPTVDQCVGEMMARETANLLRGQGDVVVLSMAGGKFKSVVAEAQLEGFRNGLKQYPGIHVTAVVGPDQQRMMEFLQGVSEEFFLKVANDYPNANAIVSFLGLPIFTKGGTKRDVATLPKVVALNLSATGQWKELVQSGVVSAVILPRYDVRWDQLEKRGECSKLFADRYLIVTEANIEQMAEKLKQLYPMSSATDHAR